MSNIKDLIKKSAIAILACIFDCRYKDIVDDNGKFSKQVKKYMRLKPIIPKLRFEYAWSPFIADISEQKMKEHGFEDAHNCLMTLFSKGNDDEKMCVSKLLYFADLLTEDSCKAVIDFAFNTQNRGYRYWTTMDISRFTFRLQKGFYKEYYSDRKALLKMIAEETEFSTHIQKKTDTQKKLCIISSMLDSSLFNSVQRVVGMVVKGLSDYYDDILVVTLDTFTPTKDEQRGLTTVLAKEKSIIHRGRIDALFNSPKTHVYYPENSGYVSKFQGILDAIYGYCPDVILDISDEYSAISYCYSKDFNTVYLPLRAVISSSYFSHLLSLAWLFQISNEKFNNVVDISKVIEWSFPEYVPVSNDTYSRKDFGLEENAFILVTVGNNKGTCTEQFIEAIVSLLNRQKNVIWILVGEEGPVYLHKHYEKLFEERKIIEWGFENNISAFYKMCNVLVRPNMTGGSGATAIAAMNHLPIAMTNFLCDANRWMGLSYSSLSTYEDLMIDVEHMINDVNYARERAGEAYNLVMKAVDGPEIWRSLYSCLCGDANNEHN